MKSTLRKKVLFTSLGLFGLCTAGSVLAAGSDSGPYVGASVGGGVTSLNGGGINSALGAQGASVSSGTSDRQENAYSANLGYRFTPNWAAEIGYADLGHFGYQANLAGSGGAVTGVFKSQGATAAGVGILPLKNGFSLYGKLGVIDANTELTAKPSNPAIALSNSKHSSAGLLTGLGASYDVTPALAVTTEWNRYGNVGNASTASGSVNTYTVGLRYKFAGL
jgi:hypothetical protein